MTLQHLRSATCCRRSLWTLFKWASICACAILDILKLLLRGVWTGRRTCWLGCGRESGIVCCFFSPKNLHTLKVRFRVSELRTKQIGQETVDSRWQCMECGGRTRVLDYDSVSTDRNLEEAEVFFPHHFYFWTVRFYCRFLQRPGWHEYEDWLGLTFPKTVLLEWTLQIGFNCLLFGCTNI